MRIKRGVVNEDYQFVESVNGTVVQMDAADFDAQCEELANNIADIEGAHVVLNDAGIPRSSIDGDSLRLIGLSARISLLCGKLEKEHQETNIIKCPTCKSSDPATHPAVQFEGEVELCPDSWHSPNAKDILQKELCTINQELARSRAENELLRNKWVNRVLEELLGWCDADPTVLEHVRPMLERIRALIEQKKPRAKEVHNDKYAEDR